ncbi:hypothetical protein VV01_01750 [Luteipulveratus halotolerans]|uniref:Uncharacterized protein n=1 Tax=Luteipulveratus halotolerans TaxID=1631356 RepID=A0A0L6CE61_9MICO|nr:hypothetical protein VV01_01750 [Luteipulveratus halotolerans]
MFLFFGVVAFAAMLVVALRGSGAANRWAGAIGCLFVVVLIWVTHRRLKTKGWEGMPTSRAGGWWMLGVGMLTLTMQFGYYFADNHPSSAMTIAGAGWTIGGVVMLIEQTHATRQRDHADR